MDIVFTLIASLLLVFLVALCMAWGGLLLMMLAWLGWQLARPLLWLAERLALSWRRYHGLYTRQDQGYRYPALRLTLRKLARRLDAWTQAQESKNAGQLARQFPTFTSAWRKLTR